MRASGVNKEGRAVICGARTGMRFPPMNTAKEPASRDCERVYEPPPSSWSNSDFSAGGGGGKASANAECRVGEEARGARSFELTGHWAPQLGPPTRTRHRADKTGYGCCGGQCSCGAP